MSKAPAPGTTVHTTTGIPGTVVKVDGFLVHITTVHGEFAIEADQFKEEIA